MGMDDGLELRIGSQHLYGSSKLSVTPLLGDPTPSAGTRHLSVAYVNAGKTFT